MLTTAAVVAVFLASSCASRVAYREATESLERGDYVSATLNAAKSLARDAKNYKALDLLVKAYPQALSAMKADAAYAMTQSSPRRWEVVARAWASIHAMNDAILRLPPLYRKGSRTALTLSMEYNQELLIRANAEAAENRYQEGMALLGPGGRAQYREAYQNFKEALSFAPAYKDAAKRAEEARDLGSDRIAVIPFTQSVGSKEAELVAGSLYDAFLSALVTAAKERTFLQVVERNRVESLLSEREFSMSDLMDGRIPSFASGFYGANVLSFAQVSGVSIAYPSIVSKTETFEVVVEEAIPGAVAVNGVLPTQKVTKRASVTSFTKKSSIAVTVAYRAVNAETSVIVDAETRTEEARDEHAWAVYLGDKEAIPARYASLVQARERDVKSPFELLPGLCSALGSRLAKRLSDRF
jgi:tetratricopeptide (TPR) repeat protein